MLRLPDTCLRRIFLLLDTDDYEQLRQVCRRFETLVIVCWRSKYKHWTRNSLEADKVNTYEWILYKLAASLEKLDLKMLTEAEINLLGKFKFPQVRTLHVAYDCGRERTQIITATFPNLENLTIEGNIDLEAISKLQNLSELNAFFYENSETEGFNVIFPQQKLRKLSLAYFYQCPRNYTQLDVDAIVQCFDSLEDIILELELFELLLPKLKEFHKLRAIGVFNSENNKVQMKELFEKLIRLFGGRVQTLISEHLFPHSIGLEQLHTLGNLEKWIVKDRSLRNVVESLEDDGNGFRQLRELQLLGDYTFGKFDVAAEEDDDDSDSDDIKDNNDNDSKEMDSSLQKEVVDQDEYNPLPLIAACRNLKILAMPHQWLNTRLKLCNLHEVLLKQLPERALMALELRCLEDDNDKQQNIYELYPNEENSFKLLHLTRATYAEKYKCYRPNCLSFQLILKS